MKESIQSSKSALKPIRVSFVSKETLCRDCHQKARRIRRRLFVYERCPVTHRNVPVRIHPQPMLYAYCDCGRSWKWKIPKGSLREIVLSTDKT